MSSKTVHRQQKKILKSSEVAKKLSNEATKLIFKSRPKLLKAVHGQQKNSQKSSEVAKKLSNEATKLIFKGSPKLHKTIQRSDKINSQKSSENAKICPLNVVTTLPPTRGGFANF